MPWNREKVPKRQRKELSAVRSNKHTGIYANVDKQTLNIWVTAKIVFKLWDKSTSYFSRITNRSHRSMRWLCSRSSIWGIKSRLSRTKSMLTSRFWLEMIKTSHRSKSAVEWTGSLNKWRKSNWFWGSKSLR